ncbi:MAG: hypothetical protein QY315_04285 [Saprospiraceae bacterium]|nr:MAG: hypothetical protein QY315_04285 [Saprospiraceae bacterium]
MSSLKELEKFNPDSKVWVFTANRVLSDTEITQINSRLEEFAQSWVSHGDPLSARAFVLHRYFVILAVDNKMYLASGCSIDTAMRFIQTLQIDFDVDLLDRQSFVYLKDHKPVLIRRKDMKSAYQDGIILDDTLFFDPLVTSWQEMREGFLKPMRDFWMKNMIR